MLFQTETIKVTDLILEDKIYKINYINKFTEPNNHTTKNKKN